MGLNKFTHIALLKNDAQKVTKKKKKKKKENNLSNLLKK